MEVIDADQVMWGTTFIGSDGMIKVSESRGVKYELPESCGINPKLPGAERLSKRGITLTTTKLDRLLS